MTGGQKAIGGATPWAISKQLAAEGVKKIYVVSDEPEQFKETKLFADKVGIFHRDELINIQKEVRAISGVTAIIYVQTCATELRSCLLYTSPSPRDIPLSRMPSSA